MRPGFFIQSGIRGMERDVALKKISNLLPVSIVLFKSDFTSPTDLHEIISKIRHIYVVENHVSEPIIAVDQEGGNVVRLPWLDYNPSNLFLGELNNVSFTRYVGALTAHQLSELGIKWNLAPVLDVLNPYNQVILERSFGTDVIRISEHGKAYIKGLQYHGVHATAKHFPGHGGVMGDSHLLLPEDKRSYETILNDAYPFRQAISAGVHSVMLSHVLYSEIDPDYPASISGKLHELLRNEFRFDGLMITDSIDMKALSDNFNKEEIVKRTLFSDVDVIESGDLNGSLELADIISNRDNGNFKDKIERIMKFIGNSFKSSYNPGSDLLKSAELIFPVVRRGVTLDPTSTIYLILLDALAESNVVEKNNLMDGVSEEIKKLNLKIHIERGIDSINKLDPGGQFVFVGRNEHLKTRVWKINEFCKGKRCAFISTGVDRDLGIIDPSIGYVSTYSQKQTTILGSLMKLIGYF